MPSRLFLGIDGGGTKCRARIRAKDGTLLGEAEGGLANIYQDFDLAIRTIRETAEAAIAAAGLAPATLARLHVGLGLAGVMTDKAAERVRQAKLPFAALSVDVDAFIACLGAHDGGDGAIVISGTGSAGLALIEGKRHSIGGWGFALGDDGSGASLGRGAMRRSVLAFDRLIPSSPVLEDLLAEFGRDRDRLSQWAKAALPRDYARLAPQIFSAAAARDKEALALVQETADGVTQMAEALLALGAPRLALIGGLAKAIANYLPESVTKRLVEPRRDPLDGAIMMARRAAGVEGWAA